mmetsp:Transcript_34228/g.52555  ORF Transcript_34228/g.52555 Transcript_34228/m.52555 type:complete len:106 (+) Transcript_34228:68-385(+)
MKQHNTHFLCLFLVLVVLAGVDGKHVLFLQWAYLVILHSFCRAIALFFLFLVCIFPNQFFCFKHGGFLSLLLLLTKPTTTAAATTILIRHILSLEFFSCLIVYSY